MIVVCSLTKANSFIGEGGWDGAVISGEKRGANWCKKVDKSLDDRRHGVDSRILYVVSLPLLYRQPHVLVPPPRRSRHVPHDSQPTPASDHPLNPFTPNMTSAALLFSAHRHLPPSIDTSTPPLRKLIGLSRLPQRPYSWFVSPHLRPEPFVIFSTTPTLPCSWNLNRVPTKRRLLIVSGFQRFASYRPRGSSTSDNRPTMGVELVRQTHVPVPHAIPEPS